MSQTQLIFEKQWLHALVLTALLAGMGLVASCDDVCTGQLWNVSTPVWFWLSIGLAVIHQIYVWFCWRTQLHASWMTATLGNFGFPLYAIGFSVLGISRAVAVFLVAISNRYTLPANAIALKFLAIIVLVPALYLFYSVKRYFGFRRAFGIDHFDEAYRSMPFERRGLFRYARNGMYIYGFLFLWAPAFWWASLAALSIAIFNHLYIWVHYFATERPDINRIYGEARSRAHRETA